MADDEKLIANNIARKIEKINDSFEVVAIARDGLEAYELSAKLLPDVVFSDIKMPELDGIALIERLHREFPSIKTVIISGFNDFEFARSALQSRTVDYLLKPINPFELKQTLEKIEAELLAALQKLAPRRDDSPAEIVKHVMEYLQHNYAQAIDFTQLSQQYNFSSSYLSKIFKEQSGTTPGKYLMDYRMNAAKKLLMDTNLSVKDIGEKVGFTDPFHFSKSFKSATGVSPAQYRESQDKFVSI
ncbi:MAG: AraC family transcriptional regulator [Ruthenibacterium sp.]